MENEKTKFIVNVFENGLPIREDIPFKETINNSIITFIESRKETENTIVALYNEHENILDILRGEDEFGVMSALAKFIKEYPSDIADTYLYAVVSSNYAATLLSFVNLEYKVMKKCLKKDKSLGLIKKSK